MCHQVTVVIVLRQMRQEIFSRELGAQNTRNMMRRSRLSSKEISGFQKGSVFVVEFIAAMKVLSLNC